MFHAVDHSDFVLDHKPESPQFMDSTVVLHRARRDFREPDPLPAGRNQQAQDLVALAFRFH